MSFTLNDAKAQLGNVLNALPGKVAFVDADSGYDFSAEVPIKANLFAITDGGTSYLSVEGAYGTAPTFSVTPVGGVVVSQNGVGSGYTEGETPVVTLTRNGAVVGDISATALAQANGALTIFFSGTTGSDDPIDVATADGSSGLIWQVVGGGAQGLSKFDSPAAYDFITEAPLAENLLALDESDTAYLSVSVENEVGEMVLEWQAIAGGGGGGAGGGVGGGVVMDAALTGMMITGVGGDPDGLAVYNVTGFQIETGSAGLQLEQPLNNSGLPKKSTIQLKLSDTISQSSNELIYIWNVPQNFEMGSLLFPESFNITEPPTVFTQFISADNSSYAVTVSAVTTDGLSIDIGSPSNSDQHKLNILIKTNAPIELDGGGGGVGMPALYPPANLVLSTVPILNPPTDVALTLAEDGSSVSLEWTAPNTLETGFKIYRMPNTNIPIGETPIGEVGAEETTFTDFAPVGGQLYSYRITAVRDDGIRHSYPVTIQIPIAPVFTSESELLYMAMEEANFDEDVYKNFFWYQSFKDDKKYNLSDVSSVAIWNVVEGNTVRLVVNETLIEVPWVQTDPGASHWVGDKETAADTATAINSALGGSGLNLGLHAWRSRNLNLEAMKVNKDYFNNSSEYSAQFINIMPREGAAFNKIKYVVTGYTITASSPAAPKAWEVEGSDDGVTWAALDSKSAIIFGSSEEKSYALNSNITPYAMHRMKVTQNGGGAETKIENIKFLGAGYDGSEVNLSEETIHIQTVALSGDIDAQEQVGLRVNDEALFQDWSGSLAVTMSDLAAKIAIELGSDATVFVDAAGLITVSSVKMGGVHLEPIESDGGYDGVSVEDTTGGPYGNGAPRLMRKGVSFAWKCAAGQPNFMLPIDANEITWPTEYLTVTKNSPKYSRGEPIVSGGTGGRGAFAKGSDFEWSIDQQPTTEDPVWAGYKFGISIRDAGSHTGKVTHEDDLIGRWKMMEGSGTTLTDSAGSNDATIYNPSDNWLGSPAGQPTGLSADGKALGPGFLNALGGFEQQNDSSSDYVQIDNSGALHPQNNFTMSIWVYFDSSKNTEWNDSCSLISKPAEAWVTLTQDPNGSPKAICWWGASSGTWSSCQILCRDQVGGSYESALNKWCLLTWVIDMTDTGSELKSYYNGVLNTTTPHDSNLVNSNTSDWQLLIGNGNLATNNFEKSAGGLNISDFRLYGESLAEEEVLKIYNSGKGDFIEPFTLQVLENQAKSHSYAVLKQQDDRYGATGYPMDNNSSTGDGDSEPWNYSTYLWDRGNDPADDPFRGGDSNVLSPVTNWTCLVGLWEKGGLVEQSPDPGYLNTSNGPRPDVWVGQYNRTDEQSQPSQGAHKGFGLTAQQSTSGTNLWGHKGELYGVPVMSNDHTFGAGQGGKTYVAQSAVPLGITPGTDPAYWLEDVSEEPPYDEWSKHKTYSSGDVVVYGSKRFLKLGNYTGWGSGNTGLYSRHAYSMVDGKADSYCRSSTKPYTGSKPYIAIAAYENDPDPGNPMPTAENKRTACGEGYDTPLGQTVFVVMKSRGGAAETPTSACSSIMQYGFGNASYGFRFQMHVDSATNKISCSVTGASSTDGMYQKYNHGYYLNWLNIDPDWTHSSGNGVQNGFWYAQAHGINAERMGYPAAYPHRDKLKILCVQLGHLDVTPVGWMAHSPIFEGKNYWDHLVPKDGVNAHRIGGGGNWNYPWSGTGAGQYEGGIINHPNYDPYGLAYSLSQTADGNAQTGGKGDGRMLLPMTDVVKVWDGEVQIPLTPQLGLYSDYNTGGATDANRAKGYAPFSGTLLNNMWGQGLHNCHRGFVNTGDFKPGTQGTCTPATIALRDSVAQSGPTSPVGRNYAFPDGSTPDLPAYKLDGSLSPNYGGTGAIAFDGGSAFGEMGWPHQTFAGGREGLPLPLCQYAGGSATRKLWQTDYENGVEKIGEQYDLNPTYGAEFYEMIRFPYMLEDSKRQDILNHLRSKYNV